MKTMTFEIREVGGNEEVWSANGYYIGTLPAGTTGVEVKKDIEDYIKNAIRLKEAGFSTDDILSMIGDAK